jgi:hypothetical protein
VEEERSTSNQSSDVYKLDRDKVDKGVKLEVQVEVIECYGEEPDECWDMGCIDCLANSN